MNVGKKYLDFTASAKEVSDLDLSSLVSTRPVYTVLFDAYHGHKVGAMRSVTSEIEVS